MKFTTNNISQTVVLDGFVLPQTLWYFGGKYQLISGENFVYVLTEKNKQNFDSINKKMGNRLGKFEDFKFGEVIKAEKLVEKLKDSKNKVIRAYYLTCLNRELNKKYDCYRKIFGVSVPTSYIKSRFKSLDYIKPYFESQKLLKNDLEKGNKDEK